MIISGSPKQWSDILAYIYIYIARIDVIDMVNEYIQPADEWLQLQLMIVNWLLTCYIIMQYRQAINYGTKYMKRTNKYPVFGESI